MMSSEHTKSKYDKHTDRRSGKTYGENRNNNRGDKNKVYKSLIPTKESGSNGKKNNTIKG